MFPTCSTTVLRRRGLPCTTWHHVMSLNRLFLLWTKKMNASVFIHYQRPRQFSADIITLEIMENQSSTSKGEIHKLQTWFSFSCQLPARSGKLHIWNPLCKLKELGYLSVEWGRRATVDSHTVHHVQQRNWLLIWSFFANPETALLSRL